jgi:arylsulfatase A-like enzyme
MRRWTVVAAILAAGAGAVRLATAPAAGSAPHIILVLVDTLRADAVGCYDARHPVTPHLDAIAGEGIRFSTAIASAPWTVPSISSLLTSRHPSEHGQGTQRRLSGPEPTTLAQALSGQGYETAAFVELAWPLLTRGFQTYDEVFTNPPERLSHPGQVAAAQTFSHAITWMTSRHKRPFFMLVHTFEVHDYFAGKPYQKAFARESLPAYHGPYLEWAVRDASRGFGTDVIDGLLKAGPDDIAFVRAGYDGAVRAVDAQIGRLDAALAAAGLSDRTILVVTSDHGEGLSPELKRVHHGGRLHDDLLKVPLVVRWPRHLSAGVVDTPVQLLDVMPTLLALAGVPPLPGLRGQSLVTPAPRGAAWLGGAQFRPRVLPPRSAFAEESAMAVDASGHRVVSSGLQAAVRTGSAKLIEGPAGLELYDLARDPEEKENRAGSGAGQGLARELADFRSSLGPLRDAQDGAVLETLRSLGYVR